MGNRAGLQPGLLLGVGVFVLLLGVASLPAGSGVSAADAAARTEAPLPDTLLVEPAANESNLLWPYTSRQESTDRRTLPINVVVRGDAETVRLLLAADDETGRRLVYNETATGWESGTGGANATVVRGSAIPWDDSHGAMRYTYVVRNGQGGWLPQTYQLQDGTYFGTRAHLRLYRGTQSWTAVQAHEEHWDWFRLRHTVESVSETRTRLERDLQSTGLVTGTTRERYANGHAIDADGWVTVVELDHRFATVANNTETRQDSSTADQSSDSLPAGLSQAGVVLGLPLVGLLGVQAARRTVGDGLWDGRLTPWHVALFAATAAIPLVVRLGAIWAEGAFPATNPKLVGAPFYLLLVLGLPATAYTFGRRIPAGAAFTAAILGMGAGVLADYAYLDIGTIPFAALTTRAVLLVGLGLVAAGGNRRAASWLKRNQYRLLGGAIWVFGVLSPALN